MRKISSKSALIQTELEASKNRKHPRLITKCKAETT
jgi:hypothetical protein